MRELTIPLPPSANRYWRIFRGRPVVSAEARAYKSTVAHIAHRALDAPLRCSVSLCADVYMENRRRDLDNCLKVLCDALNGVLYEDDRQVAEIHARRYLAPKPARGKREGYVLVTVEPLTGAQEERTADNSGGLASPPFDSSSIR